MRIVPLLILLAGCVADPDTSKHIDPIYGEDSTLYVASPHSGIGLSDYLLARPVPTLAMSQVATVTIESPYRIRAVVEEIPGIAAARWWIVTQSKVGSREPWIRLASTSASGYASEPWDVRIEGMYTGTRSRILLEGFDVLGNRVWIADSYVDMPVESLERIEPNLGDPIRSNRWMRFYVSDDTEVRRVAFAVHAENGDILRTYDLSPGQIMAAWFSDRPREIVWSYPQSLWDRVYDVTITVSDPYENSTVTTAYDWRF